MTESEHLDVGAYALGVLDDRDSALFEEHLAGCFSCAGELESLLPVVDLLSDVDPDDLVTTERATSDPYLLDRMLATVAEDRRRARSRRMYSLAAGFVLMAMLTGLALFAGARWMGDTEYTAQPGPSVSGGQASPGTPDTGFGGPELPAGERLNALDGKTGVKAEMMLESKPFGTQVSFALSRLSGPRTCRMVVLRRAVPPRSSPVGTSRIRATARTPGRRRCCCRRPPPCRGRTSARSRSRRSAATGWPPRWSPSRPELSPA